MNKRELAKAVAVHSDVDLKTVVAVLDGFTDVVTAVVAQGEPVVVSGFAKYVKVNRAARMGRNPATGEAIKIKASKKARITPVKAFKDAVMNPGSAPKLKRGVWPTDDSAVRSAGKVVALPTRRAAAKPAARKAAAKKSTARKPAARKTAARKPAARKTAARKPAARKTAARRPAARKTTAARRPAARKTTAARRPAARKTTARRPARKTTARRR